MKQKKSRIKRLEKKFSCFEPLAKILLVYERNGETAETKYQEYLDQGGDPNAEVGYIIYRSAPSRDQTTSFDDPDRKEP